MKNGRDADADAEREQRADDALPELVEVLQKRHLAAAFGSSSSNQLSDTSRAEESFELCGSGKGTTGMPVV